MGWRKAVIEHCSIYPRIEVLTPLCLDSTVHRGLSDKGLKSWVPTNAIPQRDRLAIQKSDLLITNYDTFGSDRPAIGTICEAAWAFHLDKPIISISADRVYREHPFLSYFAAATYSTTKEMIDSEIIEYFLKGITAYQNGSQYAIH